MKTKLRACLRSRWFIGVSCLLLGAGIILGVRFFTYKSDSVHYHANFALYVNGHREVFRGSQYYSEVEMCTASTAMVPMERAHMHDNINNVVHVEDHAVTWGQFFTNLGWTLGPNALINPSNTIYAEAGSQKLHLLLNGQDYTDLGGVANTVIRDHDKLLVSFGDESDATLMRQYRLIPSTSYRYDTTQDPASCSGHDESMTHERLTHLF
jgi:hypothetical protein